MSQVRRSGPGHSWGYQAVGSGVVIRCRYRLCLLAPIFVASGRFLGLFELYLTLQEDPGKGNEI